MLSFKKDFKIIINNKKKINQNNMYKINQITKSVIINEGNKISGPFFNSDMRSLEISKGTIVEKILLLFKNKALNL